MRVGCRVPDAHRGGGTAAAVTSIVGSLRPWGRVCRSVSPLAGVIDSSERERPPPGCDDAVRGRSRRCALITPARGGIRWGGSNARSVPLGVWWSGSSWLGVGGCTRRVGVPARGSPHSNDVQPPLAPGKYTAPLKMHGEARGRALSEMQRKLVH